MPGRLRASPALTVVVSVGVLLLSLGAGFVVSDRATPSGSAVPRAAALAPASTRALNVTDWSAVRDDLDAGGDTSADRQRLTNTATSRDLAARSVLAPSAEALQTLLGWSPATVSWEAFALASAGGALLLGVTEDADEVDRRLVAAGYDGAGSHRWTVPEAVPRQAGVDGPELFTHAAFLPDDGVLVFAATDAEVERVLAVADGSARSLASVRGAAAVADQVRDARSLLLQAGDLACAAADPGVGGDAVRARADAALAEVGDLVAYEWAARAVVEDEQDQEVVLAWAFGSAGTAAEQARVRGAVGDVVLGGADRDRDRPRVDGVSADGSVASLRLRRDPTGVAIMPATTPLLASACS